MPWMSRLLGPLSETISSVSGAALRAGGREDRRRRHRAGGKRSHGFEEIATLHAKSPFGFDWSFCRDSAKLMPTGPSAKALKMRRVLTSARNGRRLRFAQLHTNARFRAETLGAFVGWVERSETHQSRWVSLRSTHPTTRAEKTTDRHEAGPSLPSPIALFGRGHCVSDRGLRKRGGRIAAQPIEERRHQDVGDRDRGRDARNRRTSPCMKPKKVSTAPASAKADASTNFCVDDEDADRAEHEAGEDRAAAEHVRAPDRARRPGRACRSRRPPRWCRRRRARRRS